VRLDPSGNLAMERVSTTVKRLFWESLTSTSVPKGSTVELRLRDDGPARIVLVKIEGGTVQEVLWTIGSVEATSPTAELVAPAGTEILDGQLIVPGSYVDSPDGKVRFAYQKDSNLVLTRAGVVTWNSDTVDSGDVVHFRGSNLEMREGGSLRLVWHSNSASNHKAVLRVQNDGHVVIRAKDSDKYGPVLWSVGEPYPPVVHYTKVAPAYTNGKLGNTRALVRGEEIVSPDGCTILRLRLSGNLVLERLSGKGRTLLWESRTPWVRKDDRLSAPESLWMQGDGNLVLYQNLPGSPTPVAAVWSTKTNISGSFLAVQDDGRITIRSRSGRELWSAGMATGSTLWSLDLPVGDPRVTYRASTSA
jgi:outer membrane protein assembly factor BamB